MRRVRWVTVLQQHERGCSGSASLRCFVICCCCNPVTMLCRCYCFGKEMARTVKGDDPLPAEFDPRNDQQSVSQLESRPAALRCEYLALHELVYATECTMSGVGALLAAGEQVPDEEHSTLTVSAAKHQVPRRAGAAQPPSACRSACLPGSHSARHRQLPCAGPSMPLTCLQSTAAPSLASQVEVCAAGSYRATSGGAAEWRPPKAQQQQRQEGQVALALPQLQPLLSPGWRFVT